MKYVGLESSYSGNTLLNGWTYWAVKMWTFIEKMWTFCGLFCRQSDGCLETLIERLKINLDAGFSALDWRQLQLNRQNK